MSDTSFNSPLRGLGQATVGQEAPPEASQGSTSMDLPPVEEMAAPDMSFEDDPEKPDRISKKESEKILKEATDRFAICQEWESYARKLFLEDYKFVEGDADNGYQWPNDVRSERDIDQRPSLTINKTRQHCLQILNDQKQNKAAIKVSPVGGDATYDAAQVLAGMMRHIEYHSNAEAAYDNAANFQVKCGVGYWRVYTDYENELSFNQEIFIGPVKDPLTIYIDPDAEQADASDMRYAFVFNDIPKDLFEKKYPKYKDFGTTTVLGVGNDWVDDDHVRVAEYWRKNEKAETLYSVADKTTGKRTTMLSSKLSAEIEAMIRQDPQTRTRDIITEEVEMITIVGHRATEKKTWPGKYIPLIRVVGEESIVDGRLDRKGHVRALKDPQRMYNYWTSSAVEHVALQAKQPYIGPSVAFEGYESYWETANKVNHAFLPYNNRDDDGGEVAPPKRDEPPQMAQAYIQGMQIASQEMMSVSGQFEATFGQKGNEVSGKAITERQRPGDNATYHYINNLAIGIRYTGKVILDLFPKIYDAPRIQRIMAEDGTDDSVAIDPNQKQALVEKKDKDNKIIQRTLNPLVGQYEVQIDVGPAYGTRRQEAFNALTQIIIGNQTLTPIIGDLMLKAADFPMAEEAAERLKRMVPAQALGNGPSAEVQELKQTVQNLQASLAASIQALADKEAQIRVQQQDALVDVYKAETDRFKAIAKPAEGFNPELIRPMVMQLLQEMGMTSMEPSKDEAIRQLAPTPQGAKMTPAEGGPVPTAVRQGMDASEATLATRERGTHVMPDPHNPGQFAALTS